MASVLASAEDKRQQIQQLQRVKAELLRLQNLRRSPETSPNKSSPQKEVPARPVQLEEAFAYVRPSSNLTTPARPAVTMTHHFAAVPSAGGGELFKVIPYTPSSVADSSSTRIQPPAEGTGLETERHFWSTIEQLEAEKERLRARRAGKGLSVNGILGGNGTPGGFLGAPKPPSAARMLRESAAEAAAAAVMTARPQSRAASPVVGVSPTRQAGAATGEAAPALAGGAATSPLRGAAAPPPSAPRPLPGFASRGGSPARFGGAHYQLSSGGFAPTPAAAFRDASQFQQLNQASPRPAEQLAPAPPSAGPAPGRDWGNLSEQAQQLLSPAIPGQPPGRTAQQWAAQLALEVADLQGKLREAEAARAAAEATAKDAVAQLEQQSRSLAAQSAQLAEATRQLADLAQSARSRGAADVAEFRAQLLELQGELEAERGARQAAEAELRAARGAQAAPSAAQGQQPHPPPQQYGLPPQRGGNDIFSTPAAQQVPAFHPAPGISGGAQQTPQSKAGGQHGEYHFESPYFSQLQQQQQQQAAAAAAQQQRGSMPPPPPRPPKQTAEAAAPPQQAPAGAAEGDAPDHIESFSDLPQGGRYQLAPDHAVWYVHPTKGAWKQSADGTFDRTSETPPQPRTATKGGSAP